MIVEQTALEFQIEIRRRTLDTRAINRLIQTEAFCEAWKVATEDERKAMAAAINDCDIDHVRSWIRKVNRKSMMDLGVRDLRDIASSHHVKNYSRMQKEELVSALIEKGIETDAEGSTSDC